jgi:TrmH family RNA methyltransferase
MKFSKNNAKYVRSLQLKKYRDKFNNFVAEGDKICKEILTNQKITIDACFVSADWEAANQAILAPHAGTYSVVNTTQMKQLSVLRTPPEVLLIAQKISWDIKAIKLDRQWSLYLDGIQDPGNLGTILRIADWFGWAAVFCSPDTADLYNPKVIQSTMGAILRVPLIKITFEALEKQYPKLTAYGADMNGENVYALSNPRPGMVVIGNEGRGIRPSIQAAIDQKLHIPKGSNAGAESLNAAVACGILCATLNQY